MNCVGMIKPSVHMTVSLIINPTFVTMFTFLFRSSRLVECYPECIARADRKEPFTCSVCDRKFKFHSSMVLHEAGHVTRPSGGEDTESDGESSENEEVKQRGTCAMENTLKTKR